MLGSTYYSSSAVATALPKPKTLLSSHSFSLANLCFSTLPRRSSRERVSGSGRCRTTSTSISYSNNNNIRAAAAGTTTDVVAAVKVKAVATVKLPAEGNIEPSKLLLEVASEEHNSGDQVANTDPFLGEVSHKLAGMVGVGKGKGQLCHSSSCLRLPEEPKKIEHERMLDVYRAEKERRRSLMKTRTDPTLS